MKRRQKIQNGFINFPMDDKAYEDTQEGGLVVTLYVLDASKYEEHWRLASNDMEFWDFSKMRFTKEQMSMVWQGKTKLTRMYKSDENRGILLAMHLASTGWSGYHKKKVKMFSAEEEHLTPEGHVLIQLLTELYPKGRLMMLTSIDT